jgi:hypothetical protein
MFIRGHYIFLHSNKNNEQQEPLFIARCEQMLCSTPTIPINSLGTTSSTILRFVLNNELHISELSVKFVDIVSDTAHHSFFAFVFCSSVQSILGYSIGELIDRSIKRVLATEHWPCIDKARENCGKSFPVEHEFNETPREKERERDVMFCI